MTPDASRVNDAVPESDELPAGHNEPVKSSPEDMPPPPRLSWLHRVLPPILLVLLIMGAGLLWWQRDAVLDWVRLRGYQPNTEVKQFADQTAMTSYGRRLLYVNHPAIEDKAGFNWDSPNASKEVAVLGCFRGDRLGIYIYNVTDERLQGIQQVTAAHEMLHQAYERLDNAEKERINGLLESYAKTITDKTLNDKLDAYRKIEPDQLPNEMHSIFGTEVAQLPSELETYYARYFSDRQHVIKLHAQYQSAFTQRQEQIATYDKQLADLDTRINAAKSDLDSREKSLEHQRTQLNALLNGGHVDQYNAAVPGFNAAVTTYKQAVNTTNTLINEYNALIDKRNAIAVEEQELLKAQDSNAPSANTP